MARLSKVGYEQQYKNIIGIRWEFLRRNQDYKRDYQKYGNCKPKDMPLGLFENKYEILRPLDPSIPFFDSIKTVDGYKKKFNKYTIDNHEKIIFSYVNYCVRGAYCLNDDNAFDIYTSDEDHQKPSLKYWTKQDLLKQETIDVLISLNSPPSRILEDVKEIIQRWQNARGSGCNHHFIVECRRYCKVYDELERYSPKELAVKIKRWSLKQINRDYEEALKYINGGYRKIR